MCLTKISLNLNGVFRVQAPREIEVQINTSCEKEIFYHFQISAIAVSAIEGHSYFSTLSFFYFVEVIILIVDLDHAGRLCLHHIAFA